MQEGSDREFTGGQLLLRQWWGTSRLFRDDSGSLVQAFGKRLEVLLASLKKSLGRS